jgi:hypothetical protein
MSRRRRILLSVAAVAACLGLAWAVVAMLSPRLGVTQANFNRIEFGMTLAEVEAILGKPPDFFSGPLSNGGTVHMWTLPSGSKGTVMLSKGERVFAKLWPEADETIFRRIHRSIVPP